MSDIFAPFCSDDGKVFVQAPLAGYSDVAYRHQCIEHACLLTTTEMISVEGLLRRSRNTLGLLRRADNERHYSVQLFGSRPESFRAAVGVLLETVGRESISFIDVNAGCSVRKVVKTGAGAALMGNLPAVRLIIAAIKGECGDIPVSVKFRLGLDAAGMNYVDFADNALCAGASVLSLHPRTASQLYTGKADHRHTAILKRKFPGATVLASGDIFTLSDADGVLADTGVDGLLIARGAIGNPFFFERREPSREDRVTALERHYALLCHYFGREKASVLIRKFVGHYAKGMPKSGINLKFP